MRGSTGRERVAKRQEDLRPRNDWQAAIRGCRAGHFGRRGLRIRGWGGVRQGPLRLGLGEWSRTRVKTWAPRPGSWGGSGRGLAGCQQGTVGIPFDAVG